MHIVDVDCDRLALHAWDSGQGRMVRVPVSGAFRWDVQGPRTCVGAWADGMHVPCPDAREVTQDARCLACLRRALPQWAGHEGCIFEPGRCGPSGCQAGPSLTPHVVYLAFYGPLAKVGMSLGQRVATRVREQGADAWCVLADAPDRTAARSVERTVSFLYRIPEHRAWHETLPQLARPVPWEHVERRALEVGARMRGRYLPGPLQRVLHPLPQPVGGTPRRVQAAGAHAGTWLGAKGPHLVYREAASAARLQVGGAPVAAIRAGDLLGHRLRVVDEDA